MSTSPVLVVGGTGQVGSAVLRALAAAGRPGRSAGRGGEVRLDHDHPGSYAAALDGVEAMFVSLPDRPDAAEVEGRLLTAAELAGVRRVVKLSAASAGWEPPRSFGVSHRRAEEQLRSRDVAWTILRPTVFQETIALFCDDAAKGRMLTPRCRSAVAFVAVDDVAAVAAQALIDDDLAGQTLELTGPAALGFGDIAHQVGTILGRRVRHIGLPHAIARRALPRAAGIPPWLANEIVDLFGGLDAGLQRHVTDDVERVLERQAFPLDGRLAELLGWG